MKEVKAVSKYLRISPTKLRLRARTVLGLSAQNALMFLQYENSKGAKFLYEVLKSAVANASNNLNLDAETLMVKGVQIDEGPRLKRIMARARGKADRILKPTSHISVTLEGDTLSEGASKAVNEHKHEIKSSKKEIKRESTKMAPKKIGKESKTQSKNILKVRKEEM